MDKPAELEALRQRVAELERVEADLTRKLAVSQEQIERLLEGFGQAEADKWLLEAKVEQYKRCIRLLGNAWVTALKYIRAAEPEMFDFFYAPIISRLLPAAREKVRGE